MVQGIQPANYEAWAQDVGVEEVANSFRCPVVPLLWASGPHGLGLPVNHG